MVGSKLVFTFAFFAQIAFVTGCGNSINESNKGVEDSSNPQSSSEEETSSFQVVESALTKIWEVEYQSDDGPCIFEVKIRLARVGGDPKTPMVIYSRSCESTELGERIDFALTGSHLTQVYPTNIGTQDSIVSGGRLFFQTDYGNQCLYTIELDVDSEGNGTYHESRENCFDGNFSLDGNARLKCVSDPDQLTCS